MGALVTASDVGMLMRALVPASVVGELEGVESELGPIERPIEILVGNERGEVGESVGVVSDDGGLVGPTEVAESDEDDPSVGVGVGVGVVESDVLTGAEVEAPSVGELVGLLLDEAGVVGVGSPLDEAGVVGVVGAGSLELGVLLVGAGSLLDGGSLVLGGGGSLEDGVGVGVVGSGVEAGGGGTVELGGTTAVGGSVNGKSRRLAFVRGWTVLLDEWSSKARSTSGYKRPCNYS